MAQVVATVAGSVESVAPVEVRMWSETGLVAMYQSVVERGPVVGKR